MHSHNNKRLNLCEIHHATCIEGLGLSPPSPQNFHSKSSCLLARLLRDGILFEGARDVTTSRDWRSQQSAPSEESEKAYYNSPSWIILSHSFETQRKIENGKIIQKNVSRGVLWFLWISQRYSTLCLQS